jgi:chromate transporter
MTYIHIFWAFFISNLLGYGGGPATIPLYQAEVVNHYHWMTLKQFGDLLAIANALPGPISTKLGGFVGYQVGGILGCIDALLATVLPSSIAMILLFKFVLILKDNPYVKELTKFVQPVIAVMLGVLAIQFFGVAYQGVGMIHTLILIVVSFLAMEWKKVHPAIVIAGTLVYGAVFLS